MRASAPPAPRRLGLLHSQQQAAAAGAVSSADEASPRAAAQSRDSIMFVVLTDGAASGAAAAPPPPPQALPSDAAHHHHHHAPLLPPGPRYTRDSTRGLLQLLGCKPRLANKIALAAWDALEAAAAGGGGGGGGGGAAAASPHQRGGGLGGLGGGGGVGGAATATAAARRHQLAVHRHAPGRLAVSLPRADFMQLLCGCAARHAYAIGPASDELKVAAGLRERRRCVVVLLCGTSGSGKSTLASLLAQRLGITRVVSTDSVRHMLRGFSDAAAEPLLWASTYQAGEALAAAAAAAVRAEGGSGGGGGGTSSSADASTPDAANVHAAAADASPAPAADADADAAAASSSSAAAERAVIVGYKAQCELLSRHLRHLVAAAAARRESVIVEGVHLSVKTVTRLMSDVVEQQQQQQQGGGGGCNSASVLPFLVHIRGEAKHVERMAVRAKYMALDARRNRYVRHMRAIRAIQGYLVRKADKAGVPRVENTNVDRSVGAIHLTVMGCLRRILRGEAGSDGGAAAVCRLLSSEYAAVSEALEAAGGSGGSGLGLGGGGGSSGGGAGGTVAPETLGSPLSRTPADDGIELRAGEAALGAVVAAGASTMPLPGASQPRPIVASSSSPRGGAGGGGEGASSSSSWLSLMVVRPSASPDGDCSGALLRSPLSPLAARGLSIKFGGFGGGAGDALFDAEPSSGDDEYDGGGGAGGGGGSNGASGAGGRRRRGSGGGDGGGDGVLGSSEEGEAGPQDYGSVYESTTADEHDDDADAAGGGAGGLRGWNAGGGGGNARALWPGGYPGGIAAASAAARSQRWGGGGRPSRGGGGGGADGGGGGG